ncbi:MAG TPA: tripartite tricarboxylate transporter substrate binding protein [Burkholderiales bacterium]|nr:tripartite tricarboxylate transporter substrate binding protein [Burkholderiales bacterium]
MALVAILCGSAHAQVQVFPSKPVRLIVGFAAGGGTDIIARIISKKLADTWAAPLVVENRAGADGSIATEIVAKSPADGYTLVMITNAHTITPFQRKLNYDPVKDFAPVTLTASTPNLLVVHPSLPVKTVKEFIAFAKVHGSELTFASSGTGTSPYLAMELFKSMTGVNIVHAPYKGTGAAVIDLMGGHVQVMFGSVSGTLPYVRSGKLRALGISSPQRWPTLPEIPTVAESGVPGFEASTWYGVLAPAGTPAAVVSKLQTDIAAVLHSADVRKYVLDIGFTSVGNSPAEFSDVIRDDMARWGKLIRSLETKK